MSSCCCLRPGGPRPFEKYIPSSELPEGVRQHETERRGFKFNGWSRSPCPLTTGSKGGGGHQQQSDSSIHPFSARTRVDDGGWVCSCSLRLEQNFLPSHWSFIERDQMLNHFDFKRLGVFERARCRAALQMCDVRSIRHVSIRWEAEYNPKRRYCSLCVVGSSKNKTKQSALIKQVKTKHFALIKQVKIKHSALIKQNKAVRTHQTGQKTVGNFLQAF